MEQCPSELAHLEDVGWYHFWWSVFLGLIIFAVVNQVLLISCATQWIWRAYRQKNEKILDVTEKVTAIVPCYLPNEAAIIKETIEHLINAFIHISELDVHVVYNTPTNMDIEAELQEMTERAMPLGRRLFIERVMGSTSKAENLNHIIPKISETSEFSVIYDADHHPDPDSLARAICHLKKHREFDCVQGSTYIRQGVWWLRYVIHGEFFTTYFVNLPAMQQLTGTGFFGGSNGIWLTKSLQKLDFDHKALTEDVDCFARAVLASGLRFTFLPQCKSGELAPNSLRAFYKQRLRWAMGWDQVTLVHSGKFMGGELPLRMRLGLYWIFVGRWFMMLCGYIFAVYGVWSGIDGMLQPSSFTCTPPRVKQMQLVSFFLYAYMVFLALLQVVVHEPRISTFLSVAVYQFVIPVYGIWNGTLTSISLLRNARGNLGEWVCTPRQVEEALGKYKDQTIHNSNDVVQGSNGSSPLLDKKGGETSQYAVLLLGVASTIIGLILGSAVGSLIGHYESRATMIREVERPTAIGKWMPHGLWRWVPYGSTTDVTTVTVYDPRTIAVGVLLGGVAGMLLVLLPVLALKINAVRPTLLRMLHHRRDAEDVDASHVPKSITEDYYYHVA